ncbi:GntR family transcriptional regulator [Streptomyces sp. NPDC001185]|uniref:GntR family transcriptional regulator n=1 Tax=Streptomyces sp. NPDC001185 TaxID=3154380 RepID=UPI0033346A4B
MEQTGSLDRHGSTGHGAPDPRTAAVRVPAQSRAPERGRERGPERGQARGRDRDVAAGASTVGAAARGEHTHSETPLPPPPVRPPGENPPARTPSARPVVQRTSVRGQILAALRTALVEGELAPGEVYSAPVLGERFGVSATPVREAMQQLALEGAVEVVPNRGFRVVRRGTRELAELAEIRALIEVPVMLRLARTVSAARWSELRPLAEATVRAASTGCRATYAESDRAFHRAVLALAGNAQLVQIAEDLHRRAQWPLVGGPVSRGRADLVADAAEHTALLEALIVQDLPVVQSLVREHFAGA